jgi:hypothetical protein
MTGFNMIRTLFIVFIAELIILLKPWVWLKTGAHKKSHRPFENL